jgi:uncharacterized protein (DUF433 family)
MGHDCNMSDVTVLDKPMFSEAGAARLLDLSQATLHWWLEGGERRHKQYPPVIRQKPSGEREVTWGEFVEAGLLRQYRKRHNVKLTELRIVIDHLRQTYGVPYPLAHFQPFVGEGRKLILELQDQANLAPDFCLVAVAAGQPVLTQPAESYIHRVEWDDNLAVAWRPHADERSPVRMRPEVRYGLPAIRGIRTDVLWEQVEGSNLDFDEVAETYDLTPDEVRWAHSYEVSARAA